MADDGDGEVPSHLEPYVGQSPVALATDDSDHPFGGGTNPNDADASGSGTGGDEDEEEDADRVRVFPSQVRHLVFSGGGGKGFAFLGALAALGDFGFLVNPKLEAEKSETESGPGPTPDDFFLDDEKLAGVAGTSAGAITAALLAGRVGLGAAYDLLMDEDDTTRFFDQPRLSTVREPTGDGVESELRPPAEQAFLLHYMGGGDAVKSELEAFQDGVRDYIAEASGYEETVEDVLARADALEEWRDAHRTGRQVTDPVWLVGAALQAWNTLAGIGIPDRAIRQVFQTGQFPLYAAGLLAHEGAFSGHYVREYIEDSVRAGLRTLGRSDPGADLTFAELANSSGLDLVVVGADLESGSEGAFGPRRTPHVPVSDAVRLSMALPFLYRPTAVERGSHSGRWVDGGLVNNFPLHAFESGGRAVPPTVLGLRLDPPTGDVDGLYDYVASIGGSLFARTSENQIYTPVEANQVVDLPTGELTTLGFAPDADVVEEAMVTAAKRVFEGFGQRSEYAKYNAEKAVEERVYGNRPEPIDHSPESLEEIPKALEEQRRYSRGYVEGKFMDEMLEIIKAGVTKNTGNGETRWEPHPLAFLLDPLVRRGDVPGLDPENPDQLVDPLEEPETYRQGVRWWDRSMSPSKYDAWFYFGWGRRPTMDAGHMTSRSYLENHPYEFERFALEDKYLNQRVDADTVESKDGKKKDYTAIDIAGVPVEVETAKNLQMDEDPADAGYFSMAEAEQAEYRQDVFPVDLEFPDWEPFGGILGGLPAGTVERKKAEGETDRGWIYFGPDTDRRRLADDESQ